MNIGRMVPLCSIVVWQHGVYYCCVAVWQSYILLVYRHMMISWCHCIVWYVYRFTWYDWYHKVITLPWPCHQFIWFYINMFIKIVRYDIGIIFHYLIQSCLPHMYIYIYIRAYTCIYIYIYVRFFWSWWSPAKSVVIVTSTCGVFVLVGKKETTTGTGKIQRAPFSCLSLETWSKYFSIHHGGESTVFALPEANSECNPASP